MRSVAFRGRSPGPPVRSPFEPAATPDPTPLPEGPGWTEAEVDRYATLATDIDTAAFGRMLASLRDGQWPDPGSMRLEEIVNAVVQRGEPPQGDVPFVLTAAMSPSPFTEGAHLLSVGLQAVTVPKGARRPVSLTLLVDRSASMGRRGHAEIANASLHALVDALQPTDRVAIVAFARDADLVLPFTALTQREVVHRALDGIESRGPTDLGRGLDLAYTTASLGWDRDREARVVLATDGVATAGERDASKLTTAVAAAADAGLPLSILGIGGEVYGDATLEQLALVGDGGYHHLADDATAQRLLGADRMGMLRLVARDTKLQLAFDPRVVRRHRLLGYDDRRLPDEGFVDDEVRGGAIGSGHQVTALVEVELVDPTADQDLGEVRLRYTVPGADIGTKAHVFPLSPGLFGLAEAPAPHRLAVGVAGFTEVLRRRLPAEQLPRWQALIAGSVERGNPRHDELLEAVAAAHLTQSAPSRSQPGPSM